MRACICVYVSVSVRVFVCVCLAVFGQKTSYNVCHDFMKLIAPTAAVRIRLLLLLLTEHEKQDIAAITPARSSYSRHPCSILVVRLSQAELKHSIVLL